MGGTAAQGLGSGLTLGAGRRQPVSHFDFRVLDSFPEPGFAQLAAEVFDDFGQPSRELDVVLAAEAAGRGADLKPDKPPCLRIGVFRDGDQLVGWTCARAEAGFDLTMLNSGVARADRRLGMYSRLVQMTVEYATAQGYRSIKSRHLPANSAVIIAKLRLGFQVSGFEYSEVYGPLVCLRYLVGQPRRDLYQVRATPLVRLA